MNLKMILMVVGALLVGAGGSAAFFIMTKEEPQVVVEPAPISTNDPPGIVELEEFMVNINDPSGSRFAKLNMRLTVQPAREASSLTEDELLQARMRDRVLTLLSSKSVADLLGPVGKEGLRHEIKAQLDPLIEDGEIEDVLFQDFMVQ